MITTISRTIGDTHQGNGPASFETEPSHTGVRTLLAQEDTCACGVAIAVSLLQSTQWQKSTYSESPEPRQGVILMRYQTTPRIDTMTGPSKKNVQ